VVTNDHDFLDGHLLNDAPRRLLLVTTGNIRNDDLIALIETVDPLLVEAFEHSVLVELNRDAVIGHGRLRSRWMSRTVASSVFVLPAPAGPTNDHPMFAPSPR
jgi:hypothetical protein